jgi:hypothetical protein
LEPKLQIGFSAGYLSVLLAVVVVAVAVMVVIVVVVVVVVVQVAVVAAAAALAAECMELCPVHHAFIVNTVNLLHQLSALQYSHINVTRKALKAVPFIR